MASTTRGVGDGSAPKEFVTREVVRCSECTASPTQGAAYYLSDLAQELPLPRHREDGGPAAWAGRAAQGLGLHGAIDPEHLRAVLDGRHPTSGHRLRSERATVLGFDLTFSAPKSVSVVFALGGEDAARQVVRAHREGVQGALDYIESHALSRAARLG